MLLALILAVGVPTYGPVPEPSASASPVTGSMRVPVSKEEALILNSGSTNSAGYRLRVYDTGTVSLQQGDVPIRTRVPLRLVKQFFKDLRAAEPLDALPSMRCMKSASFGSVTRVVYREKTSPDLTCPSPSAASRALAIDATALASAAGVSMLPRPIPLP